MVLRCKSIKEIGYSKEKMNSIIVQCFLPRIYGNHGKLSYHSKLLCVNLCLRGKKMYNVAKRKVLNRKLDQK